MVAKGSPEWLSAGWTVVYRVQKTGRKIRCYKHLETGKSFVSKDEVIQFIGGSLNQKHLSTAENRKSSDCSMQPPVETNEYPSWLPDGWNVEMKTRMSGRTVGSLYKCYIDLVSGNKFYSKPEVLRYLRTLKPESRTFNQKEKNTTNTTVEQCKEADLPQGWIRKTKITKNAQGTRRDSFYTDPVTGYTFRSRLEVFRYLKTGKISRYAIKSKKRNSTDQPLINDKSSSVTKRQKAEKTQARQPVTTGKGKCKKAGEEILEDERKQTEDGLKTSPQKSDASATKLDKKHINYYPKTVRKQLYEKKGKNNRKSKIQSNPTNLLLPENVLGPSTTVGFSRGTDLPEKETGGEKAQITAQITQSKPRKSKNKKLKDHMPSHRSSKRLAGKEPECMPISKSRLCSPRVSDGNGVKVVTLPDLNLNSDSYADKPSEELVVNPEAQGVDHAFDETNGASNGKLDRSCENKEQSTSRVVETETVDKGDSEEQFSVPIADFFSDPCLEFAIKTLTGALPVVDATNNGPDSILVANNSQGKILTESHIDKRSRGNPKTLKNKKEICFPRQSLKRSAELKLEPGANSMATEQGWQNSGRVLCKNKAIVEEVLAAIKPVKGPGNVSSTIIGDTTIHGEAFKKSAKPNENQAIFNENHHGRAENKSAESISSFPYGFSWSDPCLDFAFKTLTGSIPVDDSLGIHTFFQENLESGHLQRDSTITLPDFGSTSYFQSDNISSQFDPAGNSGTNSSFLPMGNVRLPGFGTMRQAHIKGDKVSKGK